MIDFACKKFELKEVIKCGLGLTRADFEIFTFLLKIKKEFSSNEISKETGLEISTVQRSLKRLFEKKVIIRKQKNLENGGYIFYYLIKNKKEISEIVMKIVNNWVNIVEEEIEKW